MAPCVQDVLMKLKKNYPITSNRYYRPYREGIMDEGINKVD